jgi:hypothetical protein
VFCHQVLGETVRPRRRPARKRTPISTPANGTDTTSGSTPANEVGARAEQSTNPDGSEAPQTRTRGPRIAQVRMLKPQST